MRFLLPTAYCLLPTLVFAQPRPLPTPKDDAPPKPDSKYALTIYSTADPASFDPQAVAQERQFNPACRLPGFGVVRELRKVPLVAGDNLLKFTDVAAGIDPTTVSFRSLTAPDATRVLEQNFEYDLLSPDKLLSKYVGKNIIVNRKQEALPGDRTRMPETIEARLLSFTAEQLVLQTNNKQLPVQIIPRTADITEIKLFDLQTGLITKPTLVWRLNTPLAGDHDVLVSYQTDNITWRADYTVIIDKADTAADVSSWVTVANESGAAYPDAKLKLVAGDVRRLRDQADPARRGGGLFGGGRGDATGFAEKSFFEYHLYTLGRPTSIANNSTKQIELFPLKPNVPAAKTYVYAGIDADSGLPGVEPFTDRDVRKPGNKKVDVYLAINNTEKNGLGIPLPAGRVRVYKRDDAAAADEFANALEFVGEDKIDHTPKDEQLLIRVGSSFDVVGERKRTDFTEGQQTISESFEITLRNHKKEHVPVIVRETLYRHRQWQVTEASDKFTKHDSRTIHFNAEVPPNQEKAITYTVKYTW